MTADHVASQLYCSASKISRIETGRVRATLRDVRDLLELYGISSEQHDHFFQLAREAQRRDAWWHSYGQFPDMRTYVGFEAAADSIHQYGLLLIPGLLQVREYARAIISAILSHLQPWEIERAVELRMTRQSILVGEDAPTLWVVLDEAALHRPVGRREVTRKQFDNLIEASDMPNVTLQVLPFTAGEHPGMNGEFTIFMFAESADPDVVALEHPAGDLYVDTSDEVSRFKQVLQDLRTLALSPEDSVVLLAKLARGL